jgi:hypothetical protein
MWLKALSARSLSRLPARIRFRWGSWLSAPPAQVRWRGERPKIRQDGAERFDSLVVPSVSAGRAALANSRGDDPGWLVPVWNRQRDGKAAISDFPRARKTDPWSRRPRGGAGGDKGLATSVSDHRGATVSAPGGEQQIKHLRLIDEDQFVKEPRVLGSAETGARLCGASLVPVAATRRRCGRGVGLEAFIRSHRRILWVNGSARATG